MTSVPEKPESARLLARADDLRQAERRAASARMVSVAGHLIGTPLNVIAGRAALIRSSPSPEAIEENVRRIEEQVERLALRIRRLIDYFGLAEPGLERRQVADVVHECSELYGPVAEFKGVGLELSVQGVETLSIEASLSPLVLTTLLSLALRSATPGQSVRLVASEHGPKIVAFELGLPGLDAPPTNFDRLEPPEHGLRYDPGALEAFWTCLGLARRLGGAFVVTKAASGAGVTVRFECPHA
ncbi:MAG TPA: histidine kinase dimerization/phospho-acceptor domain-containing protein [Polyangiaceae bacterium]|nr:histidine kinase dimerization/phospho-acceptor domain-containing protein [Polyangiaceae bacterium]